jgi:predicted metalloprotease with PDZ domain
MSVSYDVTVVPARQEIEVQMRVAAPARSGVLVLETPTWVPGNYKFAAYGRDVFGVRAVDDSTGSSVPVPRESWQGYRIESRDGSVSIAYTAYCGDLDFSESCGILNGQNGVLLGTRYLRLDGEAGPCEVTYHVPTGWDLHHPSGAHRLGPTSWRYPSYEILLDTPVVMGHFDRLLRSVHGTPFHLIFLDQGIGFQAGAERFADAVAKGAAGCHDVFGAFPFEDYTFVISLDPRNNWGLEHLTSTMVGLGSEAFIDDDQFGIGVRACIHELFHAWNVRRLRPATLGRLDLRRGSFTEGLWMAEGFTRYYEFLIGTRTGLYSPTQFFSSMVNYYGHLEALPSYRRVTALDSSAASYLNHGSYPGAPNNTFDYYAKGMLIAFGIDALLRRGRAAQSLDSVFRAFYAAYAGRGDGYTPEQVLDFLAGIDPAASAQLAHQIGEPGGVDLPAELFELGFQVSTKDVPYLGLILQDGRGPSIYGVLDTGPAGDSGLAPGDVILGVNGFEFSVKALKYAVRNAASLQLEIRRGHQVRRHIAAPSKRTAIASLTWHGDAAQASRIETWLGSDFRPAAGTSIPLDFYENFHGIETVV